MGRQTTVGLSTTAIFIVFAGYFFGNFRAETDGLISPNCDKPLRIPEQDTTTASSSATATTVITQNETSIVDDLYQSLVMTAGNSFSLQCVSPVETTFRWAYCPFGDRESKVIYNTDRINPIFHVAEKASVTDCDAINCTFDVDNVQLDDAGFFTCMPSTDNKYWSVTVLQGKMTTLLIFTICLCLK